MIRRQRYLFGVGALVVTALFVFGWFGYRRLSLRSYNPQVKFSAQAWASDPILIRGPSSRQLMIRDLVLNVLPRSNKTEIDRLLGASRAPAEMRRHSQQDFLMRERNLDGTWKPFPRTGTGYYGDEFDWDLAYIIGYKQKLFGTSSSRRMEELFLRFDSNGVFSSWYIDGSELWPCIVGKKGEQTQRRTR